MADKNKTIGYIVFGLGIGLLVVTFSLAIYTYLNPDFIEGFSEIVQNGEGPLAPIVGFLMYLIPAIFIFAMGSVAGKIAKYGIKMIRSPEKKMVEDLKNRQRYPTSSQTNRTPTRQVTTGSTGPQRTDQQQSQQSRQEQPKS